LSYNIQKTRLSNFG